jgi:uncharacterized protein (DUF983 family)
MTRPLKCRSCGEKAKLGHDACEKCGRKYHAVLSTAGKIAIALGFVGGLVTTYVLLAGL